MPWQAACEGTRCAASCSPHPLTPPARPQAWKLLGDGALWPARAVADLKSGDLLEKDSNITVSPR